MTKVTYYMYSYDTCCNIREMMEMDGLDSAKCQKSRRRDMIGIFELLMRLDKNVNSVVFFIKRQKWAEMGSGWT